MKVVDFVATSLSMQSSQIEGLAYLFLNYQSTGTRDRDNEAIYGIGAMLDDLAQRTRRLATLSDLAEGQPNLEIDVDWDGPDPIGQAERQVEAANSKEPKKQA